MAEKKDPYKFTIQFNAGDPCHEQVTMLLNQQGRKKAQLIVNAIMHYLHCKETPDIPQMPLDTQMIEAVVRRILSEQAAGPPAPAEKQIKPSVSRTEAPENFRFEQAAEPFDPEGLAAIVNSMALFRKD